MSRARSEAVERKTEARIEAISVGVNTDVAVGAVSDWRRELDTVSALLEAGGSWTLEAANLASTPALEAALN